MSIRLGTRASTLALTQAKQVADRIEQALGETVELVEVRTDGDRSQAHGTPIAESGTTGVFVTALRSELAVGTIDVAVHSYKDLPTAQPADLLVAAVPARADARDALVARDGLTLGELPPGAVVGTGSPRRAAQLAALGLGLEVVGIRGNVDTRIGKVRSGSVDAVVLAKAGLDRIGRGDEATEVLDPIQMLPAPAQGALAVECRAEGGLAEQLAVLDDVPSRVTVQAERSLLRTLEGGCSAPIGALAEFVEADPAEPDEVDEVWLRAVALSADGSLSIRQSASGGVNQAEQVGVRLAEQMLDEGAADLLAAPLPDTVTT